MFSQKGSSAVYLCVFVCAHVKESEQEGKKGFQMDTTVCGFRQIKRLL